jgi:uncharacterized protein YciI
MRDEPDAVRAVAPEHAAYWHDRGLRDYIGGPFADRSGGLITFAAGSMEEAERLVAADPFVREGLLENSVVKQWIPSDHSGDSSGGLCMAMIGGRRFGVPYLLTPKRWTGVQIAS